jgi:hypothetical protein
MNHRGLSSCAHVNERTNITERRICSTKQRCRRNEHGHRTTYQTMTTITLSTNALKFHFSIDKIDTNSTRRFDIVQTQSTNEEKGGVPIRELFKNKIINQIGFLRLTTSLTQPKRRAVSLDEFHHNML